MLITKKSMQTGIVHTQSIDITPQQYEQVENRFNTGEHIQYIVPHLNSSDREFLMTGITEEEWAEMSADGPENEDENTEIDLPFSGEPVDNTGVLSDEKHRGIVIIGHVGLGHSFAVAALEEAKLKLDDRIVIVDHIDQLVSEKIMIENRDKVHILENLHQVEPYFIPDGKNRNKKLKHREHSKFKKK